jgi:hypothetical protein
MFDEATAVENKINFYKKDIDNPYSVNGFRGTWKFSDHTLIPDTLFGFLQRHFGVAKVRRIPLDQINKLMNEVWEGPGSLEKVLRIEAEMKLAGKEIKLDSRDWMKDKKDEEEEDDGPLALFGSVELDIELEEEEEK